MTANELDPRSVGGTAGQGGSISSAAPSNSPGGAADLDSRPVVGLVAHVVDLDAIEARHRESAPTDVWRDVSGLLAEVRALRAEVAALNAETRARCERIRAALDRK